MGITDIFKNSNEKKLMDKLLNINIKELDKGMESYGKYERMRQTWNKIGNSTVGLYFKIKKGESITRQDIENAKKGSLAGGNIENTEEFKFYFKVLEGIVSTQEADSTTKFINTDEEIKAKKELEASGDELITHMSELKDLLNKSYSSYIEDLQKQVEPLTVEVREKWKKYSVCLEKIRQLFETTNKKRNSDEFKKNYVATKNRLRVAEELQKWMYGKDNFYEKGAQKVFNKYKDIYNLVMKCNESKFFNCILEHIQNLNMSSEAKLRKIPFAAVDTLAKLSREAFGDNKYEKKFAGLQELLQDLNTELLKNK